MVVRPRACVRRRFRPAKKELHRGSSRVPGFYFPLASDEQRFTRAVHAVREISRRGEPAPGLFLSSFGTWLVARPRLVCSSPHILFFVRAWTTRADPVRAAPAHAGETGTHACLRRLDCTASGIEARLAAFVMFARRTGLDVADLVMENSFSTSKFASTKIYDAADMKEGTGTARTFFAEIISKMREGGRRHAPSHHARHQHRLRV